MKICCLIALSFFLLSCHKKDSGNNPGTINPSTPSNPKNSDSLSDRLQFFSAVKKQGQLPSAPSGSSVKISVKDTLYLLDQVKRTIKFLHKDTTKNIAGMYLQVYEGSLGGPINTSYYYDVPEIPELSGSDTVSVITVGFDPSGMTPPFTFNIRIIPYDKHKQPVGRADRPVKVLNHKADPAGVSSCGLVLPASEYWDWDASFIPASPATQTAAHDFDFWDDPSTYFGAEGQTIKGSCCAGISIYGPCPGTTQLNASLHFATYYHIASETFSFNSNGTFLRQTFEESPSPLPDSSDFCAGGEGRIRYHLNHVIYNGNYSVTKTTPPADLYKDDTLKLVLNLTSTSGSGGYGNSGGIIHQLNCETLGLIQVDLEGHGQHLYKFYSRRKSGDPIWFDLQ